MEVVREEDVEAEILNDKKGQSGVECDQEDVRQREQYAQRPCDGRTLNVPETGRTTTMPRA